MTYHGERQVVSELVETKVQRCGQDACHNGCITGKLGGGRGGCLKTLVITEASGLGFPLGLDVVST